MLLQRDAELGALGVLHGNEVLDRQRVQHLAAEALGGDAGADALARRVDRRRRAGRATADHEHRSEEHTSELQSLMRISYAVFCLKKKNKSRNTKITARN